MKYLRELLARYSRSLPAERAAVEEEIWNAFGVEKTALILDMSAFSALTQRHGIVHFLGMVTRMQAAAVEVLAETNGELVKFEADNLFAVFERSRDALRAARRMNELLAAMNISTDDDHDIYASIGISRGRILLMPGEDFFGNAVNLACKLGEDIAQRSEILVTAEIFEECGGEADWVFSPLNVALHGLSFSAFRADPVS